MLSFKIKGLLSIITLTMGFYYGISTCKVYKTIMSNSLNSDDTTITPFADKSYKLSLHIFNTELETWGDEKNAILKFYRVHSGKNQIIFQDSLYCFHQFPHIELHDMNGDKSEDILIFNNTGARANGHYYLYVVDPVRHRLIRVKKFQEVVNPEYNKRYNIIESVALAGTDYYSFYRISSKNKLIDLGHGFEASEGLPDVRIFERKYNAAIKKILKEHKH
jgi:hypothetical protein